MSDSRVEKLANVLVHYSLDLKLGDQLRIQTSPLAEELTLALYKEALTAGAHIDIVNNPGQIMELFYNHASEEQLQHISPTAKLAVETYDASLFIEALHNTRALTSVDPKRFSITAKAAEPLFKTRFERTAKGEHRWCLTAFPTPAAAQEADMSLSEYEDFVYTSGKLNEPDPAASWLEESEKMHELKSYLEEKDQIILEGDDIELQLSIKDRRFEVADGRINFPDGEIFTAPVEDSVNGWVRFRYPAIYRGREVSDIKLWFEDGPVVKSEASKGEELLKQLLDTDAGAKTLGEWGIGTNYSITKFTKNILFDEKLGGTIHFAVGATYPKTGGLNQSAIHWDMLCDMSNSQIHADGELFYRDGKPLMWD